jgi:hypothetical protein
VSAAFFFSAYTNSHKIKEESKGHFVDTNIQVTQARPRVYVVYFDIETQVTPKKQMSRNLFKSRAYVQSSFE